MKRGILGVAIFMLVAAVPALAAQKPKSQAKPHTVTKSAVKPQAAHGKSTVKLQAKSNVKPAKIKTTIKTSTKSPAPKTKTRTTTTAKTSKKTTTTPGTTTTTTTTTTTATLTPVQQKLERNTNLAAKLRSRLPAGTDLMTAAAGFKNLGQFVSAVNASYNHGLAFEGLKQRIVYENMSLGQAMKDMR